MQPTTAEPVRLPTAPPPTVPDDRWRALLHRWFVQYNPFYLVSAMLVLAGLNLVSRGFVQAGSEHGALVVAALSDLYAVSLVGGTALLVRSGQRRSAVMLAMLAIVYQGDPMLHTETCVLLGAVGWLAGAAWFVAFMLKLVALGHALRVRIAPRTLVTATVGALGVWLGPQLLPLVGPAQRGVLVALFVTVLGASCPRGARETLVSRDGLDAWGHVVLARSVRVAWSVCALLLAVHVAFWSNQIELELLPVGVALAFAATRGLGERRTWAVLVVGTVVVLVAAPAQLSCVTFLAALTLLLRARSWRERAGSETTAAAGEPSPYRGGAAAPGLAVVRPDAEGLRLLTFALLFAYVGAWTFGWQGGSWPAHRALVDGLFVLGSVGVAWRLGGRLVLGFAPAVAGHALVVAGWLPRPQSPLGWGGALLATGFLLLFGSLAVSHRAQRQHPA